MIRSVTCLALGAVAALAGCAEGLPGFRPLTYADPAEARVFVSGDNCIHSPSDKEFAPLVAAFLSGAASKVLDNFGNALADAAKGGALPPSAATANFSVLPTQIPKCIVVVRGRFAAHGTSGPALKLEDILWQPSDVRAADMLVTYKKLGIPDIYSIDHFIELQLLSAKSGKAMTFAPVYMWINKSVNGDAHGNRDVSIALKFNRPGADPTGGVVVLSDSVIGEAQSFTPDNHTLRFTHESPWFLSFHQAGSADPTKQGVQTDTGTKKPVAPTANQKPQGAVAGAASDAAGAAAPAAASDPAVIGGGGAGSGGNGNGGNANGGLVAPSSGSINVQSPDKTAVPVTATATIVETRPARGGLAFIAAVFTAAEPKVGAAATNLFDTSGRAKAQLDSETSLLEANATLSDTQGKARVAVLAYCKTSAQTDDTAGQTDRITKSSAARVAQLKANDAALKAGEDPIFPNLIAISADVGGGVNAEYCSKGP